MQELIIIVKIPPEMRKTEKEHSNVTPQDVLEGVTFFGDTRILQTGALRKEVAYVKSNKQSVTVHSPAGVVFESVVVDPVNLQTLELDPLSEDKIIKPSIGYDGFDEVHLKASETIVDVADTSATENDVKVGKEFYKADGTKVVGTFSVSSKGIDRLQWKCNSMKTLYYEFAGYQYDDLYEAINGLDTKYVENMQSTFERCESMTRTPILDMRAVVNATDILKGCKDIEEVNFLNVMCSLVLGDSYKMWGTKISVANIIKLLNELCRCEDTLTLTLSPVVYNNIIDVYVKPTHRYIPDGTDIYFDRKDECVLCDSSDPEAQGIIEYAYSIKNWIITGGEN